MLISCSLRGHFTGNTCHCCAERRMIAFLRELSKRRGNSPAQMTHWIHRKFGEMVIRRERVDGQMGISLPCIVCRKQLDRLQIPWRAHIHDTWISSRDLVIPPSKLTHRQKIILQAKQRSCLKILV